MKYLIVSLLFLTGCTIDNSPALMEELRDVKYELQSCKNSMAAATGNSDTASAMHPEPEQQQQPQEPQYVDVDVYEVDGTKCYGTDDLDNTPACGRSFWKCNDGANRECMTNFKYKRKTERKLVQDEE